MAVASSGALSLSALAAEFGGTGPISLSAFYRGAGRVPAVGAPNIGIPANGPLPLSAFRGGARTATVTYEAIGGGGGGGYGLEDGSGSGRAGSGGNTVLAPSAGASPITAAGALGGLNGQSSTSGGAGASSAYGPGGAGVGPKIAGVSAPATSYGAGGGGAGGDSPSTYDSSGLGGLGGNAAVLATGTLTLVYGTTVAVTIGLGGLGASASRRGGDGARGYARLAWDGKAVAFTSSGVATIN